MELATPFYHLRHPTLLRYSNNPSYPRAGRQCCNIGIGGTLDNHHQSVQRLDVFSLSNTYRTFVLGHSSSRTNMPYRPSISGCLQKSRHLESSLYFAFRRDVVNWIYCRVWAASFTALVDLDKTGDRYHWINRGHAECPFFNLQFHKGSGELLLGRPQRITQRIIIRCPFNNTRISLCIRTALARAVASVSCPICTSSSTESPWSIGRTS